VTVDQNLTLPVPNGSRALRQVTATVEQNSARHMAFGGKK